MGRPITVLVALIGVIIVGLPMFGSLASLTASQEAPSQCGTAANGFGTVPEVAGLTPERVQIAKTIYDRARAARLGNEAAVIGIAVADQESALGVAPGIQTPNADGDAGIFQQRTLRGWYGTLAQVLNPTYAADRFFLGKVITQADVQAAHRAGTRPAGPVGYKIPGLVDVTGWKEMSIVGAAHRVQRSAFPSAVEDNIPLARKLVSLFRANVSESSGEGRAVFQSGDCGPLDAMSCPPSKSPAEHGVQPDTLRVIRCVAQQWPQIHTFGGLRPDPLPDHPSGRAVDIMIPDHQSPAGVNLGAAIAAWLKNHAKQLGIQYVIWQQRIWNIERDAEGWRTMADRGSDSANHLDHVHVTTYGTAAGTDTGGGAGPFPNNPKVVRGVVAPVASYTIAATFGQVGIWARYHTGLDFAAPIGTPIRAAAAGEVIHAGRNARSSWAGNYVTIRHADGTHTLYAHMSTIAVRVGQTVGAGQGIGAIGMTGRTFGPHLHFETYPAGTTPGRVYQATDPAAWLTARGSRV